MPSGFYRFHSETISDLTQPSSTDIVCLLPTKLCANNSKDSRINRERLCLHGFEYLKCRGKLNDYTSFIHSTMCQVFPNSWSCKDRNQEPGPGLEQIWFQGWFCPTGLIIFLSVPQLPPLWNGCWGKDLLSPYLKPVCPRLGFWQLWDKQGLVSVYWILHAITSLHICLLFQADPLEYSMQNLEPEDVPGRELKKENQVHLF